MAPKHLDKLAQEKWREIVKTLKAVGVYSAKVDGYAIALYCQSYSLWAEATAKVLEFGPTLKNRGGCAFPNPYMEIASNAFRQMLDIASETGLTPKARA